MMLIERESQVVTAHGHMPTYLIRPDSSEPLAPIVVFMDAPGIREELLDVARRLARAGFYCAVPDLYYRLGRIRLDLTRRTQAHAEVYRALSASLVNAEVISDTANLLGHLAAQGEVREGPAGCLGFSVGGRFAIQAAGCFPAQVAAAASICGTGIVTDKDDSPHRMLAHSMAQLLFEFAETDPQVPANVIPSLQAALEDRKERYRIHVAPGTSHGYTFPLRPMYRSQAAADTWQRLLDLFRQALQASRP